MASRPALLFSLALVALLCAAALVASRAGGTSPAVAALLLQLLTSATGASLSLNGSQALQCGRALDAIWHASGPPAARDSRTADTLEVVTASEYQLASTCARCVLVLLRLHEIGAAAWCSIDLQLVHGLLAVAVRAPSATRVSLHDSLRPSLCDRADEDDDDGVLDKMGDALGDALGAFTGFFLGSGEFEARHPNHLPNPRVEHKNPLVNFYWQLLETSADGVEVEIEPAEEVIMDESMWGVSVLIFTEPMGVLTSALLLFLLVLNVICQILFIWILGSTDLTQPTYTYNLVAQYRNWRRVDAHAVNNYDALTETILSKRVCDGTVISVAAEVSDAFGTVDEYLGDLGSKGILMCGSPSSRGS